MIHLGCTADGSRVALTPQDTRTHVHGIGASQKGKSRLIEQIARELVHQGQGFCVIDPNGSLYSNVLRWLAYARPRRQVTLLNPSYEHRVVGFNPFTLDPISDDALLWTKVDRMVAATLRAWNQTDANHTPRLERWLRTLYFTLLDQGLSIAAARYFLSYEHKSIRDAIISRVRSPEVREEWHNLTAAAGKQGFVGKLESAGNRLQRFIVHPTVRRTMGLRSNNIDLDAICAGRQILLVNLQPSDRLSEEAARVIGTLLVNEVWEIMRRRDVGAGRRPGSFALIIDEFQQFATPDVADILDQGAKYGLHLFLFHQRLSQLGADLHGAIRNAQTRIVFGGLPRVEVSQLLEGGRPSAPALATGLDDVTVTMRHGQRRFSLIRPERPLEIVSAALVEPAAVSNRRVDQYVAQQVSTYLVPADVDALLTREPVLNLGGEVLGHTRSAMNETGPGKQDARRTLRTTQDGQPPTAARQDDPPPVSNEAPSFLPGPLLGRGGAQHKYLQQLLKRWGEEKGYRATIEKPVLGGVGSVDVVLERGDSSIACEISVTTTLDHEIGNLQKCLAADFSHVVFVSSEKKVLQKAREIFEDAVGPTSAERVHLFAPEDFLFFLESLEVDHTTKEKSVLGYKVKVAYTPTTRDEQRARKEAIAQAIMKAMKRMRDRD